MATLNKPRPRIHTHEGAIAKHITPLQALKRSVMSCLLWEKEFYEDGIRIADRIKALVPKVDPIDVSKLAVIARNKMKLRHVPLLLAREMCRNQHPISNGTALVSSTIAAIIQRPDELAEFLAMYWQDGKCPISAQAKKGLAQAFCKFDTYQLAKYNRDNAIKLRDVLFLCHAKPKDDEQAKVWKELVDGKLAAPDTWEVALSSGADKKETWERLLSENKLGELALIRNLRNMIQAGVDRSPIADAIMTMNSQRVLPFRFIAAARHAPKFEVHLECKLLESLKEKPRFSGHTVVLVDVSGSMGCQLSRRSDMERIDAACGVAMCLREVCESVSVYSFSNSVVEVPARRGFALRDAINSSQDHGGTYLGKAVNHVLRSEAVDRLVVITDEQSHDPVPDPPSNIKSYMLNVASNRNCVGYGPWIHIDGFSEAVIDYMLEFEQIGTIQESEADASRED